MNIIRNSFLFGFAILLSAGLGYANTAPAITNTTFSFPAQVNTTASWQVSAEDAEGDDLHFSFVEMTSFGVVFEKTEADGTSPASVSNSFTVPVAAGGETISIEVTVTDVDLAETKSVFSFVVDNPPVIESTAYTYSVREMDYLVWTVTASNPEAGSVSLRYLNRSGFSVYLEKTSETVVSGRRTVNSVGAPAGTYQKAILIDVEATDAEGSVTVKRFTFNVDSKNLAPVVSVLASQGSNDKGDYSNPFQPGGVDVFVQISDDFASFKKVSWGASLTSGSFCGGGLQFFGAEDHDASLIVPLVRSKSSVLISVSVNDGMHDVPASRTVYIDPLPGGCNPSGGGGGSDPLDTITASATPSTVGVGGNISLVGDMDSAYKGSASPAWYLIPSTSGSNPVLLTNNWTYTYKAPSYPGTVKFRFLVGYDGSTSPARDFTVVVTDSGSGGGPECGTCSAGAPPIVDAGPAAAEVQGGQSLALSGAAGDPNLPPTIIPTFDYRWEVVSNPSGANVSIQNSTSREATLLTAAVTSDTTVTLKFTATAGSNGCSCSDTILVTIRGQGGSGGFNGTAQIQYAFPEENLTASSNGQTVLKNVSFLPVSLSLKAVAGQFTAPQYQWSSASPSVQFSAATSSLTSMTLTPLSGETSVSAAVTLTIREASDATKSAQSTLTFQVVGPDISNPPTNVSFTMTPGAEGEVGTLALVEAMASSGSGGSGGNLQYLWSVKRNDGYEVEVLKSGAKAMFFIPAAFGATSKLTVTLTVSEGSAQAQPVSKDLWIGLPKMRFAHFGVGKIPSVGQELIVELVMINDESEPVDGAVLSFRDGTGEPLLLSVTGESQPKSSVTFSLTAGGAKRLTLKSPDGNVYAGWAEVRSPAKLTGLLLYKYIDQGTQRVRTETAQYSSKAGRRFTMALGTGPNSDVGLAIANPTDQTISFSIQVKASQTGQGVAVDMELAPGEQEAKFLSQLFQTFPIPENFPGGTLILSVDPESEGSLVATVLRLRDGYLSTIPLAVRSE